MERGGIFQGTVVFVNHRLHKQMETSPAGSPAALGQVRGFVLTVGSRVFSPAHATLTHVPASTGARGSFRSLTKHDNVALEEGASEDKANFIRMIGFDEGWLRVLKALGPVLELVEVNGRTSICGDVGKGPGQARCAGRGGGAVPASPPL